MEKRGQVTILIILAVVVILGVVVFFWVRGGVKEDKSLISLPDSVRPLAEFVQNCIETTASEGIVYNTQRGGYYDFVGEKTDLEIPYFAIENKNLIISKERMEEELASYIEWNLDSCLDDYKRFSEFEVSTTLYRKFDVIINEEEVLVESVFPHSVNSGDRNYEFEFFDAKISARIGLLHEISTFLVEDWIENKGSICVSCIVELGDEHDLRIIYTEINSNENIFSITDNKNKLYEDEVSFLYATK